MFLCFHPALTFLVFFCFQRLRGLSEFTDLLRLPPHPTPSFSSSSGLKWRHLHLKRRGRCQPAIIGGSAQEDAESFQSERVDGGRGLRVEDTSSLTGPDECLVAPFV